jgi:hypothetical protein
VRTLASVGLWGGWGAGLLALAIPRPAALTTVRVVAPAAVVAAVAAAPRAGSAFALAVVWTAVCCAWTYAPALGSWAVNGAVYPDERRFLLRVPGPLLFGPLALGWALAVAGLASGPLLLASRSWLAGGVALVVGLPLAALLLRAIHTLSRRWVVFVPAGVVLHDPVALVDPVLLRRQSVRRLGPAPVDSDALDLTQRAPGLALELALESPIELSLLAPGQRVGKPATAQRLLFTPTRPGALLEEARRRRLAVD